MKEAIATIWVKEITAAAKRDDPEGNRWSFVDRRTIVTLIFDRNGTIAGTELLRSSGADYVDVVSLSAPVGVQVGPLPGCLSQAADPVRLPFAFTLLSAYTR